ncbi:MAG: CHAT domain-containing protein [Microscillaceae bacterium]|nr:CHAT domain-containing protein [Microscillaceae bacterium]
MAGLYESTGRYAEAETLYKQASDILIKQTESNFANLSEKEKGLFFQTFSNNFEVYNSFTLRAYRQIPAFTGWLYDNTLVIKGLLLQSSQKMRQAILSSGDEVLKKQFADWQAKKNLLAQAYHLPIAEREKRGIKTEQVETEGNELEKLLSLRASQLPNLSGFENLTGLKPSTWQDVQKKLKAGEAAIEIIRTRYFDNQWTDSVLYIALIVRPETQGQPEMLVIPNGNDLENKVFQYYRNCIQYRRPDTRSFAHYWQPLAEKLAGVRKAYLAADGVYLQLSLPALLNPVTNRYLIEEIDVHLLGSTRDLLRPTRPPRATEAALLLGRPAYDLGLARHQSLSQHYPPTTRSGEETIAYYTVGERLANITWNDLPATETEVREIRTQLLAAGQAATLYLGENAVEEVIKNARNPRILHLATHGFFFTPKAKVRVDTTQRMESIDLDIDFGSGRGFELSASGSKAGPPSAKQEAMLRSGVVLTGVSTYYRQPEAYQGKGIEDGLLTAYEAQNLHLDETELVVLSACQTGEGEVQNGEGVYGLQRGFQQAGARAVLMSMWSVADEATQRLMGLFYENWLGKKQSKREAFKNAQLALKAEYPEPFFWGAFVMVGE